MCITKTLGPTVILPTLPYEITPISATQSQSIDGRNAGFAVDKDLMTGSLIEPSIENGVMWLRLDFDKTYFIHTITIHTSFYTNWYYPDSSCLKHVDIYKGCKDATNKNLDIMVYQTGAPVTCATLHQEYGLDKHDQIYTFACSRPGDMVMLSSTSGTIEVYEVVVTSTGNLYQT